MILPLQQILLQYSKQTAAWQHLLAAITMVQPHRLQGPTVLSSKVNSNSLSKRRSCFSHWSCAQMLMQRMSTACAGTPQTTLCWRQQATIMRSSCGDFTHDCRHKIANKTGMTMLHQHAMFVW